MSDNSQSNREGLSFEFAQVLMIIAVIIVSDFYAGTGTIEVGVRQFHAVLGNAMLPISQSAKNTIIIVFGIILAILIASSIIPLLLTAIIRTRERWVELTS